jgi:hypothetical protein
LGKVEPNPPLKKVEPNPPLKKVEPNQPLKKVEPNPPLKKVEPNSNKQYQTRKYKNITLYFYICLAQPFLKVEDLAPPFSKVELKVV